MNYNRIGKTSSYWSIGILTLLFAVTATNSYAWQLNTGLANVYKDEVAVQQMDDADISTLNTIVTLNAGEHLFVKILQSITEQAGLKFSYSKQFVPVDKKVHIRETKKMTARKALERVLRGTTYRYDIPVSGQLVLVKNQLSNVQQLEQVVAGTVTDASTGEVLPGVNVVVKGTTVGASTDEEGAYSLEVPSPADTLIFSFIGFETQTVPIQGRTIIDVFLQPQTFEGEELVVVGYGTQRKESVLGAVTTVDSELLNTPSRSLSNSLAGNVSGVIAVQRSGEPGYDDANFWIRGISTFGAGSNPLILVDGVERSLNNIDPEVIESFTVLKDASATAIYGIQGANGVVLIQTKRGTMGKPEINLTMESGFSGSTMLPDFVGGAAYATLYNEGKILRGEQPFFTQEVIKKYRTQSEPYLYPSVDWMDKLLKDWSSNQSMNLNVTGGGDVARYFISASYLSENGIFAVDELNKYDTNINLKRYNFRANVDVDLHKNTKLSIGLGAILIDSQYPGTGTAAIFSNIMRANPTLVPAMYPNGRIPNLISGATDNPYMSLTQSGFSTEFRNTLQSTIQLEQNLSSIVEGLFANIKFAFDARNFHYIQRHKTPNTWIATGKDAEGNLTYRQTQIGDRYLGFAKQSWGNRSRYLEVSLDYRNQFGKHRVSGLLLFNRRNYLDAEATSSIGALPYREQGIAGRATYSYDDRYYLEANFAYNGSENFRQGERYGFFPSVALGWRVAEEDFWDPLQSTINHLKLNASYGIAGNDEIGGGRRFIYMNVIGEGNGGYNFGPDNTGYGGRGVQEWGSRDATWEIATMTNVGVEVEFFNKFMIHANLFYERREGIFLRRNSTPAILGIRSIPWANIGEMENQGLDGTIEYSDTFGDLAFTIRANYTYAHNTIIDNDEPEKRYAYQSRQGKRLDQQFGLVALKLFESEEEIANSPEQAFGDYMVGDIKYKDVNGDGVVDSYDEVAIGYSHIPEIVYGFGASIRYKNVDFSFLFQGIDNASIMLGGEGFFPFLQGGNRGNVLVKVKEDRWTPFDPDPYATFPRLKVGDMPNNYRSSTWWQRDGSFIRLKNAEIGYTFPVSWVEALRIENIRIYANGINLFTFSSFDLWDPEMEDNRGADYPPQRVINFGININF